jgi:hypothetical protein
VIGVDPSAAELLSQSLLAAGLPAADPDADGSRLYAVDFFQNAPIALHWLSGTGHVLWANQTESRPPRLERTACIVP